MAEFKKRVYGCAIVKAINSNYNADFSGQPRTLPDGIVYATDKAFKYSIKKYLKDAYENVEVFYMKTLNDNLNPRSLDERYEYLFRALPKDDTKKKDVAKNLLSCLDVKLFGATFTSGNNSVSVHGPVQINHGVNIWKDNNIYTEQITSPFRNEKKGKDRETEKSMTTIGRQSRLEEGHYLHHFSINPGNLDDISEIVGEGAKLSSADIDKLKVGMRCGVTWYDSASKAGCENEMLVWVELKEGSKLVLPSFATLINLEDEKDKGKCVYDFEALTNKLEDIKSSVESVEVYYNKQTCILKNLTEEVKQYDI
uniref:type I CRISPR-associated protein Cas7 n=1 Tax=Segatella hominis TaxID=2518605 RepID=UPI0040280332